MHVSLNTYARIMESRTGVALPPLRDGFAGRRFDGRAQHLGQRDRIEGALEFGREHDVLEHGVGDEPTGRFIAALNRPTRRTIPPQGQEAAGVVQNVVRESGFAPEPSGKVES